MIEYFLANMWQVWAIVAIVCLILELSSGDLLAIVYLCHLLATEHLLRTTGSSALAA